MEGKSFSRDKSGLVIFQCTFLFWQPKWKKNCYSKKKEIVHLQVSHKKISDLQKSEGKNADFSQNNLFFK